MNINAIISHMINKVSRYRTLRMNLKVFLKSAQNLDHHEFLSNLTGKLENTAVSKMRNQ